MPDPGEEARVALERLRMLRVAKDLFLSDWYRRSPEMLQFSAESRAQLERIAEESAQERADALKVIDTWSRELTRSEAERTIDVARTARRDFLLSLIDAKEAAGEVFERAASIAPEPLRTQLQDLAEIDWRHSLELRDLLVAEVQEVWRLRAKRGPPDVA